MSDSEEARARSSRSDGVLDPSIGAAIQSAVSVSMGSLPITSLRLLNHGLAISRSDFLRRTARPLNKQSRELVANNIPVRGKEISSSWIILSRCWIN